MDGDAGQREQGSMRRCESERAENMAKTHAQEQRELRAKHKLPFRCECGGLMEYDYDFGRIWSHCRKCSPVTKVLLKRGQVVAPAEVRETKSEK